MPGLPAERRGPKDRWKLTAELRAKSWRLVLREGVWEREAIQRGLAQTWHQAVSVPGGGLRTAVASGARHRFG